MGRKNCSRIWQGQQLVARHIRAESMEDRLKALEELRDHVDCGNPYIHIVIAHLAGTIGEQEKERLAAERLKDFGPQFAAKAQFSEQSSAEAIVGLLASFDMLKPKTAATVQADPETPQDRT